MALNFTEGELLKNRYRFLSPLGKGGFSVVWLVEDTYTQSQVALKIFAPDKGLDQSGLAQFQKEYRRTRGLRHPNLLVPDHFDILEEVHSPYLVMPYCPNGSLSERFHPGGARATEQDIAQILRQIGSGLAALHEGSIIHQDIKPDNILIGESGQYMLTDFGISRQMRSTLNKATANQSYLTVAYSPPERYTKNPVDTPAGDIFSLGITLYELCTGEVPWGGVGGMVLNSGAEVPDLPPQYSSRLNAIIRACMDKNYNSRPSARELASFGETFLKEQFWPEFAVQSRELKEGPDTTPGSRRRTQKIDTGPSGVHDGQTQGEGGRTRPGKQRPVISRTRQTGSRMIMTAAGGMLILALTLFSLISGLWTEAGYDEFQKGMEYFVTLEADSAYYYFSEAAAKEYAQAYYFLGRLHHVTTEEGVGLDYERAETYYLMGVEGGDMKSHYGLGLLYEQGQGAEVGTLQAQIHFEKALPSIRREAEAGNAFWQNRLGSMYGDGQGVPADDAMAVEWYRKSAEQGYFGGQLNLGFQYHYGNGVEEDFARAIEWYEKAVDQGFSLALNNMGAMYVEGEGVPKDVEKGIELYTRAYEAGSDLSANNLGDLYRSGNGVPRDYSKAMNWYKKAADLGDSQSLYMLGYMYDRGEGTDHDWSKAAGFYKKASDLGHATAGRFLGEMYVFGVGGKQKDMNQARYYLNRAANLGDARAKVHLQVLDQVGRESSYTETNSSGDRVTVTNNLKEPFVMSGLTYRWNEKVTVDFNKATRRKIAASPSVLENLEPDDDLYFATSWNYYRDSDWKYGDGSTTTVHVRVNGPSRSIGYMYVITELDTENIIVKLPMAFCWKPE